MRFKETQQYLKPLYARLRNRSLDPTLLAGLVMIVEHCKERNYLAAYEVRAALCALCCAALRLVMIVEHCKERNYLAAYEVRAVLWSAALCCAVLRCVHSSAQSWSSRPACTSFRCFRANGSEHAGSERIMC